MGKNKSIEKNSSTADFSHYLFNRRTLIALILPLVAEQLLTIMEGLADSIMIASVGEAAVSGVSLVDSIMVLVNLIFSAMAAGGAVVAGQYLGQKNTERADESARQLMWVMLALSIIVTALLYLCRWFILHVVFGQIDENVMYNADVYLMIVAASVPFIALYNGGAAIFRAMGDSKTSMRVSLLMNIINVIGNALLIFEFHRGTEGVAIPTLVSRMVAAFLMLFLLKKSGRTISIPTDTPYRPDWKIIKNILRIGVPNGLENGMFQLGKIIILSLVSTFGTYSIAANAVGNTIGNFQTMSGMAMSLAVVTVISQCMGAGDVKQARYYVRKLMKITYLFMDAFGILILLGLPLVMKVYGLSQEATNAATLLLTIHGVSAMLIWPLSFTLPNVFRASGDVKFSMIVSTASMWIFRILFSYVFGQYLGFGVVGVWAAMIVDWICRICFFVPHYFRGKWTSYKAV